MTRTIIRAIAALALVATVAGAHAGPVTLDYEGFVAGSRNGRIFGPEVSSERRVAAGQFRFAVTQDPHDLLWDDELHAFCIDVTQTLVTGGNARYILESARHSSFLTDAERANIAWLYDNRADQLGSGQNDAAFQLALWEIMYDSTPMSLQGGTFRANSFGSGTGSRGVAQSWLDAMPVTLGPDFMYTSSSYEFYVLRPDDPVNNQTLIVARPTPVPEPPALALIGLGLALVGLKRCRAGSTGQHRA